MKRANHFICVSEALVELSKPYRSSESVANTVVNGIDVASFRDKSNQVASVSAPSTPYMVGLGRLSSQKGFDLLLKAYAHALATNPSILDLVILGSGVDDDALKKLAKDLSIERKVHFLGFIENPAPILKKSKLFLLSSRFEGYPLVLVEAMALGVPSISFDCETGPREILKGGDLGVLVPNGDVVQFAQAINEHLEEPNPLLAKTRVGFESCEQEYSTEMTAKRHLEYLQSIVQQTGSNRSH
ncbi:MAG: glycosyltransferase [Henriciella sp.]|nr:glycosyltransferase [Henriciella sp.]